MNNNQKNMNALVDLDQQVIKLKAEKAELLGVLPTKKEWCAKESEIFLKGGEAVRKEQSQSSTQKAAQMSTKKAVAALKKIIKLQNEINDLKVIVELAISEKFGNDSGLSHAASDGWCLDVSGGFGGLNPISPELLNELLCMNAEQARLKLEYTSI